MASKNRSAWEIRYRALKQRLSMMEENLLHNAGAQALKENLNEARREELSTRLSTIGEIKTRLRELEDMPPSRIWLMND